jgi:hypothetical protein
VYVTGSEMLEVTLARYVRTGQWVPVRLRSHSSIGNREGYLLCKKEKVQNRRQNKERANVIRTIRLEQWSKKKSVNLGHVVIEI